MKTAPRLPSYDLQWSGAAASAISRRIESRHYAGYDPYDALMGGRVPKWMLRFAATRRGLTQLVKRTPVALQPALGVRPHTDAYTLGHALLAMARLGVWRGVSLKVACARVLADLRHLCLSGDDWIAWGYHFPVHTRFFSYGPSTPNLIVTAFVVKGLAAATRVGAIDGRDELRGAATFVLAQLPRIIDATGQCFGYLPGESAIVHNANMLAALVLCESGDLCEEEAWLDEAHACAHFTIARQNPDGSWPYSEETYGQWIDGFHTGFVLEGLARTLQARRDETTSEALKRGLSFYVSQLFGTMGEPKYYPESAFPLDALSAAQGVETLQVAVGGPAAESVPGQLQWIRRHMVRPNGHVAYQVHQGWTDWREFPRWSSAPMMSALAGAARRSA